MLGPEECCWGVKRNPTREHQKGNEANSVLIFLLLLLLILFAILILILLFLCFLTFRCDEASRRLHLGTALDIITAVRVPVTLIWFRPALTSIPRWPMTGKWCEGDPGRPVRLASRW
jgi:hypothetical protein